jgi:hypothetical protein
LEFYSTRSLATTSGTCESGTDTFDGFSVTGLPVKQLNQCYTFVDELDNGYPGFLNAATSSVVLYTDTLVTSDDKPVAVWVVADFDVKGEKFLDYCVVSNASALLQS